MAVAAMRFVAAASLVRHSLWLLHPMALLLPFSLAEARILDFVAPVTSCCWALISTLLLNMVFHISPTCSILQPSILAPLFYRSTPYSFLQSLPLSRFLGEIPPPLLFGIPPDPQRWHAPDLAGDRSPILSTISIALVPPTDPRFPISTCLLSLDLLSHFGPSLLFTGPYLWSPILHIPTVVSFPYPPFLPDQFPSIIYLFQ